MGMVSLLTTLLSEDRHSKPEVVGKVLSNQSCLYHMSQQLADSSLRNSVAGFGEHTAAPEPGHRALDLYLAMQASCDGIGAPADGQHLAASSQAERGCRAPHSRPALH